MSGNRSANSAPDMSLNNSANQVLQLLANFSSQFQQSTQQDQSDTPGSNLAMRSHSRGQRSSPIGIQRPKTKRATPTSLERQGLFMRQSARESPARSTREFPKTFVVLSKKFQPNARLKPSSSELDDLTDGGLGEVVVQLEDEDSATVVLNKLQLCCPLLKSLNGWIVMLKAVSTNSSSMEVILRGKPILSGAELHRLNARVYVAPLKKDLIIPPKLSKFCVECEDCGEMIDSIFMMEHMEECSGEKRQIDQHPTGSNSSSTPTSGTSSELSGGTPSTSRFRGQPLLTYRPSSASTCRSSSASTSRSSSASTSGPSSASTSGPFSASISPTPSGLTARTTSAVASSWQSVCEICGESVDYFLMLDHIESCSSSSRKTLTPSTSQATLMAQNELDDNAVIDQCETSSDLSVDNECGFFMLDHDGDIQTTVEQCSSVPSTEHQLDDAKQSTSGASILIDMFATEAAIDKLEGFKQKIKLTDGSNVLRLSRPYYVKAAVNASQTAKFMESILSKFVVVFKGEEGVDVGGVRRDFFSHLFHRFVNILIDNRAYMEGEAGTSLSETEYAAGIFFGIAILQEAIYHPATIELLKTGGPRFVEGLNVFGNLGDFLIAENSLHSLFKSNPLTPDGMISLLRREENSDPNLEIIEKMNFLFICKFFKEVFNGLINFHVAGENKPMILEDVLQFLTGKRIIAPGDESVIQIVFIKVTEDGFRRPAVSTCTQKITATLAEEYEVMRDVWIEAVAQLIVGFTLN